MNTTNTSRRCRRVALLAAVGLAGCLGGPPVRPSSGSASPVLYAAGSYDDGQKTIPCYWVEAARTDLPGDGVHGAEADCVFVGPRGAVYSAGYYSDGKKRVPCRWRGTTRTDLPGSAGGEAVSLFVSSEGWPHEAGFSLENSGTTQIACYWAGSSRIDLPSGSAGSALAIFTSGAKVYTAGYYQDGARLIPCYWVGTRRTDLPSGSPTAQAASIVVADGIVYTAGADGGVPCYWTGTTQTMLPGRGFATSISVAGGRVFTAGESVGGRACYWAGATETDLPGDGPRSDIASSILVSGDTVYAAGVHDNGSVEVPCSWTDSVRTDFPDAAKGVKINSTLLK